MSDLVAAVLALHAAPADRYLQRVKDAEATAHAAREEMLRLSERLRLRKETAEERAEQAEAANERVRELGTGWTAIDPASLYGDTEKAQILASAGRAILATLAQPDDQPTDGAGT